jgi:hypothetical protein
MRTGIKGSFSKLAGNTIGAERVAGAVADLDRAEDDISAAKQRITTG